MAFVSEPMLVFLVAGFAALLYFTSNQRRVRAALSKFPGPPSKSFLEGHVKEMFSRPGAEFNREIALKYGPVVRLFGEFGYPFAYISDPLALRHILIKDDNIFVESKVFLTCNYLAFGHGLLAMSGEKHRKQRKMLNPVFSIKHMRQIQPVFYSVVHKLRDAITAEIAKGSTEVDMLQWMGRTALELVGQGGLGYSFDPLVKETDDKYSEALKAYEPGMQRLAFWRRFLPYIYQIGPASLRRSILDYIPSRRVHETKAVIDTMHQHSVALFEKKRKAFEKGEEAVTRQVGEGKDIMSILMRANMLSPGEDKLSDEEVIGQMTTMVFAATDTTSNSLARMLYKLSENQVVQERLREEIIKANAGELLTYDQLDELPFLDAVCRETLRVYPPATLLNRVANQDAIVPLSKPMVGTDGKVMHEVFLPKGTEIIIGVIGSNVSKERWGDDALEWKPERWLSPLPEAVTDANIPGVYANLLTFLGGKRACIGFKFSEMEMKIVLSVLLSNFRFELTEKPIEWNVGGIWYPTIGKESNVAMMPLKVTRYQRSA